MRKILLTGMSGTGKSSALAELAKRGFEVVDTDHGGWSLWSNDAGGYVWDERRIEALLAREEVRRSTSPALCRTRGASTRASMLSFS